ncbi:MAG: aminomethyl-transferring glycine dehydrogenase subunit GcvPA [Roseiflexaceae bacterium]
MSHYISITAAERAEMLAAIGVNATSDLFVDIPSEVRFPRLNLPDAMSEITVRRELTRMATANAGAHSHSMFLGAGAYNHFVPSAIDSILRRSEFYTAYTPYQPEVSQGTLQAIFEYQSLMCALTGMDVANASHYDGATALAEAAVMAVNVLRNRRTVVIAPSLHPHYRRVIRTLLVGSGIEVVGDENLQASLIDVMKHVDSGTAAVMIQSPDFFGTIHDLKALADATHAAGALFVHHFDPIALALFQTPHDAGADIGTAEGQALGIGLNFGGPYLGIFTTRKQFVHKIAGRIVGLTRDVDHTMAYVMTLRAREQDIRRERATSNICTNQALMALAAAVYMSLMGRQGMRQVATLTYQNTHYAAAQIGALAGYQVVDNGPFFREFVVKCPKPVAQLNAALADVGIIGGYDLGQDYPHLANHMLVAATEMNDRADIDNFVAQLKALR